MKFPLTSERCALSKLFCLFVLAGCSARASTGGAGDDELSPIGSGGEGAGSSEPASGQGGTEAPGEGGSASRGGNDLAGDPPPAELNLLANDPGFEQGEGPWTGFGDSGTARLEEQGRGGGTCLRSFDRQESWQGPVLSIADIVEPGRDYEFGVWVRLIDAPSAEVVASSVVSCSGSDDSATYTPLAHVTADASWRHLTATFKASACETRLYIEGPPAATDFCIDDVSLALVVP